jgi:tetrahydromethanopterin S-methyltransferase subunit G
MIGIISKVYMDKDRLIRLEDKIDKITDKLNEVNVTLAENTQSLIIHEKRTDIAEKKLDTFEKQRSEDKIRFDEIEKKLDPVYSHVILLNAFVKYGVPIIAAAATLLLKFEVLKF